MIPHPVLHSSPRKRRKLNLVFPNEILQEIFKSFNSFSECIRSTSLVCFEWLQTAHNEEVKSYLIQKETKISGVKYADYKRWTIFNTRKDNFFPVETEKMLPVPREWSPTISETLALKVKGLWNNAMVGFKSHLLQRALDTTLLKLPDYSSESYGCSTLFLCYLAAFIVQNFQENVLIITHGDGALKSLSRRLHSVDGILHSIDGIEYNAMGDTMWEFSNGKWLSISVLGTRDFCQFKKPFMVLCDHIRLTAKVFKQEDKDVEVFNLENALDADLVFGFGHKIKVDVIHFGFGHTRTVNVLNLDCTV